ncbi:hypothetical protein [Reinekea sp.]|uniref:hypothetical protein n=1 Tax=Reinekea sp. TaxID=1970455 RepID=UPI00398A0D73
MNNLIVKKLINMMILAPWLLTGCASIDLSKVEPEKLTVDIQMVAEADRQSIDVFLSRGLWSQPVKLDQAEDAMIAINTGEFLSLNPARKNGRYGLQLTQGDQAIRFLLNGVGEVTLPRLDEVILTDKNIIEGQAFFKTDRITLDLNESQADVRYLVFTTQCGNASANASIDLSKNAHQYSLTMSDVMRRLNNSAEADLTGMLPIQMQLVEGALVNWPHPFQAKQLIARDSTDFFIDTSGFKITGSITINPSSAVSLLLTNRQWPVTYCY